MSKNFILKFIMVAIVVSVLAALSTSVYVWRATKKVNLEFRINGQDFARVLYELYAWHRNQLPDYKEHSKEEVVRQALGKYDSVAEIARLNALASKLRKREYPQERPPRIGMELKEGSFIRLERWKGDKLSDAEREYYDGVDEFYTIVWEYQRNPLSEATWWAFLAFASVLTGLAATVAIWRLIFLPIIETMWVITLRAISDISNAIRGNTK